ncbi:unnamed protein product [marine sediment metagenome]|uniref:Uncharacterized protein n=1 Tax=marine sediment metagenome TaxID=412755 RepID=X1USE6_9ZZZZ
MSQERIEQERVRKIIYANLDRLFEELAKLNQNLNSTGRISKKKEKREKTEIRSKQGANFVSHG